MNRCGWAKGEQYVAYHDEEWGVPLHDDRALFELLLLEGAQAGLSWSTILAKRDNYRRAFDGFEPARIARYGDAKVASLLADAGIVRNRAKVAAAIGNARAFLALLAEGGTFDAFLWQFVGGRPLQNRRRPSGNRAGTPTVPGFLSGTPTELRSMCGVIGSGSRVAASSSRRQCGMRPSAKRMNHTSSKLLLETH